MTARSRFVFVCPSCQTENRPTAKFCRKCGLPRPAAAESESAEQAPAAASAQAQPAAPAAQAKAEPDATGARAATEPLAVAAGPRAAGNVEPSQPSTTRGAATLAPGAPEAAPVQEEEEELSEEITEEEVEAEVAKVSQAPVAVSGNGEPAGESSPAAPAAEAGAAVESGRRGGPTCPACGSNVRATDKFCIWCGERQPMRVMPKMKRCSECRAQLPMTANFC
ncbi:MAG TPA: zinc-ribbon domain-containing protein, partial [Candidatus Obscuribacterales bacterium]